MIYFWSDPHLQSRKSIDFFNRPFKNESEMDEKMIFNVNQMVKEKDFLYVLGDFMQKISGGKKFWDYWKQLNGEKIFANGNHDGNNGVPFKNHRIVLNIAGIYVNLIHNPEDGNSDYPINIHGHLHGLNKNQKVKIIDGKSLYYDCGVDCNNYRPVSWEKIYSIYQQWKSGKDVEKLYNE